MSTSITEDEFAEALRSFGQSAFRLEAGTYYAVEIEADAFRRFLDGSPLPPSELEWWQAWLDGVRELTRQGKSIARVRIVSDPPSEYQRWEIWGTPWHAEAGEQIGYLSRQEAVALGIQPDNDWWLLDDERLILMHWTDSGEFGVKTITTDPTLIAEHRRWRDLAIRHAVTAERFAPV